jgi:Flp pilus assembly protein TadG
MAGFVRRFRSGIGRLAGQTTSQLTGKLRRFRRDEGGTMAMMMGLAAIPLIFSVGAGVDYGSANTAKSKLDSVADTAALSAVDHLAISGTAAAAQITAQNAFNAGAANLPNVTVTNVSATVTDSTSGRTAVVNYTATKSNMFMGAFGIPSTTISGQATAAAGLSTYIDFYLLLDNTPSMGVGATTADINTMVNNTPDQCAFACHDTSNASNYYNLAKSLGVTMRIDVLKTATQSLMNTATTIETLPNQYRMAVYTFGTSATNTALTNVVALTSNLSGAESSVSNIDLMTVNGQNQNNDQDTNYDGIIPAINTAIPSPGPGTQASPQKVLFFVSDGVADENNPNSCSEQTVGGVRCQEPINDALCTAIKNRGVQIAVLYTTYLPLPTNAWYNQYIGPFSNSISPQMQSCASPGLFFAVSPTQGIAEAMTALFQNAVMTARLVK